MLSAVVTPGGFAGLLDPERMAAAAVRLPGRRDCRALVAGPLERSSIVTIYRAGWAAEGPKLSFTIAADRFLPKMVRTLVGAMVAVGRGVTSVEAFAQALEAGDRRVLGRTAPSGGLCLTAVGYPDWQPAEELTALVPACIGEGIGSAEEHHRSTYG